MKRMVIIATAFFLALGSCSGQTGKKEINDQGKTDKPRTNVQVKKVYDDHGNLIKYDSAYTYVYSSPQMKGDLRDSVITEFQKHFGQNEFFGNESFFKDIFSRDSLLMNSDMFGNDFFNRDFFSKDFGFNSQNMEKFFSQMDSVRKEFFRHELKPETDHKQ